MASVEKRYNKAGNLISFRIHVFHGRDEFGKQLPPFIKTVRVPPELNARQIETLIQRETVHFEEECELITAREKEEAAKAAEPKCISFEDFAVKVMEIKERTGKEKSTLARYQDMLSYFAGKYPDKMKVHIGYSEELAHQIYASCDAFLMPSLFEPCGLSQLMSLRYGTVPIVRETGGLKDTVIPYNEYTKEGTGFSFANYNAHEMLATIRYALSVFYQHKNDWDILIKHGMSQDFSWNASVAEYEKLYDSLMTKFT